MALKVRPEFFDNLARDYFAKLVRCFILTGNIHDLFSCQSAGEGPIFVGLELLLQESFANARYPVSGGKDRFIVLAVKSDGIHFVSKDDESELLKLASSLQSRNDFQEVLDDLRKTKESSLADVQALGRFLRAVAFARDFFEKAKSEFYIRPLCVIVDQAETIFPNLEIDRMTLQDRETWKCFYDLLRDENVWPDNATADKRPDVIILLSQTAAEINAKILTAPKTELIAAPLPDEEARRDFIAERAKQFPDLSFYRGKHDPVEEFTADSRGLTLRCLDDIITAAHRCPNNFLLNRPAVTAEANKKLSLELGDAVKIVRPEHTMADIVGFRELKLWLEYLAQWMDDPKRAPSGMTVVGPNGAGKTYIIEAWAASTGREVLTFGAVRSEWYGRTEAFMEKFEAVASAFGRVCVVIDEAHKAFGSLHDRRTYEAEAHLARSVIQMISNPKYRSRIFWVLITTRPDLLDPDFVRSGRCSLFVPVFDPEGKDADDFFSWMLENFRQEGIALSQKAAEALKEKSRRPGQEFSAGDYKRFVDDFIAEQAYRKKRAGRGIALAGFLKRWTPSSVAISQERELQICLAALRCDRPELLPKKLRRSARASLQKRIDELTFRFSF